MSTDVEWREPVAAIDCGTNTVKLLVGSFVDGELDVLVRESRMVRLGQGVDETGRLADEALERAFAAVDEYAAILRDHGVRPGADPVLRHLGHPRRRQRRRVHRRRPGRGWGSRRRC